jgi:pyruvate, orthophosphate dikinase
VTAALAGRELTVDGTAGVVYAGRLPTEDIRPSDVPGLDELLAWAREIAPAAIVDAAPDAVDLDADGPLADPDATPDVEELTARLRGASAARGTVLATPEGARAALAAGVHTIVPLPGQQPAALLLRLVQEMPYPEEEKIP